MLNYLLHAGTDDKAILSRIQVHCGVVAVQGLGNIGKNLVFRGGRLQLPLLRLLLLAGLGNVPAKDVGYRDAVLVCSDEEVGLSPSVLAIRYRSIGDRTDIARCARFFL